MAKSKPLPPPSPGHTDTLVDDLPNDIIGEPISNEPAEAAESAGATNTSEAVEPQSATVEIPLGELHDGYLSNHVEARLDDKQRRNMRRMLHGLRQRGTVMANGRFVETNADAIRWMLEQLG